MISRQVGKDNVVGAEVEPPERFAPRSGAAAILYAPYRYANSEAAMPEETVALSAAGAFLILEPPVSVSCNNTSSKLEDRPWGTANVEVARVMLEPAPRPV